MKIDIFKNMNLWNFLAFYNNQIYRRWKRSADRDGSTYIWKNGKTMSSEADIWFNPKTVQQIPFPRNYPELIPLNYDPKFVVDENRCCYLGIFLINLLYCYRQEVLIEDRCCGMGKFTFLLSQLGYNNFHLVDDFSQIDPNCIGTMMEGIPYKINESDVKPVIINQSGYPYMLEDRPIGDAELICLYNNEGITNWANEHLTFLCEDSDQLCRAYCRPDKLVEFQIQIERYEVKQ